MYVCVKSPEIFWPRIDPGGWFVYRRRNWYRGMVSRQRVLEFEPRGYRKGTLLNRAEERDL